MNKKAALFTVFLVVMIDLIGFGIVLPGLESYAASLGASTLFAGFIYSAYSLAQLFFSPVWGRLSDRIGRRPVMMLSTLGASLAYTLFAFTSSLWMLLLCRLFAGVMAGNISTAQAYVADVTEEKDRARGMGLIGAAFGIGFLIGPAIGGVVAKFYPQNTFFVMGLLAASLSALSFFSVYFFLPDPPKTIPQNTERRVWKMLGTLQQVGKSEFIWLLSCVFLITLGQASIYAAFPNFCRVQLQLPLEQVYHQYILMGVIAVFIQGGLLRVLLKKFTELGLFKTGVVFLALGLGAIPFSTNTSWLTLSMAIMAIGGSLAVPTLNSLVSKKSSPQNYGATLGVSQSFSALARAIGPTWGSALMGLAYQAPFVITAALVFATITFPISEKRS